MVSLRAATLLAAVFMAGAVWGGAAATGCRRPFVSAVEPQTHVCANVTSTGLSGFATNCNATQCRYGCNWVHNLVDGITTSPYPLDSQATLDAGLMWATQSIANSEVTFSFYPGHDGKYPNISGFTMYVTGNPDHDPANMLVLRRTAETLNLEEVENYLPLFDYPGESVYTYNFTDAQLGQVEYVMYMIQFSQGGSSTGDTRILEVEFNQVLSSETCQPATCAAGNYSVQGSTLDTTDPYAVVSPCSCAWGVGVPMGVNYGQIGSDFPIALPVVVSGDGTVAAIRHTDNSEYGWGVRTYKWNTPITNQWNLFGDAIRESTGFNDFAFGKRLALSFDGSVLLTGNTYEAKAYWWNTSSATGNWSRLGTPSPLQVWGSSPGVRESESPMIFVHGDYMTSLSADGTIAVVGPRVYQWNSSVGHWEQKGPDIVPAVGTGRRIGNGISANGKIVMGSVYSYKGVIYTSTSFSTIRSVLRTILRAL